MSRPSIVGTPAMGFLFSPHHLVIPQYHYNRPLDASCGTFLLSTTWYRSILAPSSFTSWSICIDQDLINRSSCYHTRRGSSCCRPCYRFISNGCSVSCAGAPRLLPVYFLFFTGAPSSTAVISMSEHPAPPSSPAPEYS
jgi:hypothetical protein